MPLLKGYGFWRGRPTNWEPLAKPDHGSLSFSAGTGALGHLSSAVNVLSKSEDSRLVYWVNRDWRHELGPKLLQQAQGFHNLEHQPGGLALDFLRVRPALFEVADGVILSHDGGANDIVGFLTPILDSAVSAKADLFLFGEPYKKTTGGDGIHDIHMNQGSRDGINPDTGKWMEFQKYNGVYQDGAILLHFPDGHWEAIFLGFASQASRTDENGDAAGPLWAEVLPVGTGPVVGGPGEGDDGSGGVEPGPGAAVVIEAAMVNPVGDDANVRPGEVVYLLNQSASPVSLAGWTIGNKARQQQPLDDDATLAPLSHAAFPVPRAPLSNKGGVITLLDGAGNEVHRVEYSKQQASVEGTLVYFTGATRHLRRHLLTAPAQ